MQTPRIGMIGLGLMGLGIATNIVKKGYALTAMVHPGNQPLADPQTPLPALVGQLARGALKS